MPPDLAHGVLKLHCTYNIREILTVVGFLTAQKRPPFQAGVRSLTEHKTKLLFVTPDKSSALHERVAYEDYTVSSHLFHWQGQNSAAPKTESGKRYLESRDNRGKFQLFVRKDRQAPCRACGPVHLKSAHGERPMNITWELEHPLPAWLFQEFSMLQ